jgi:hypothetical protein
MKNVIILFCLITSIQTVFAQNNNPNNANAALAGYSNPMERFTETIKYLETIDSHSSNNIDSATCIDLLKIAQQLKNDSLLAISYNWIGYYFSGSKGDNSTALEYYFKALPLAEKYNDKRRISSLYFDISTIYYYLKNIDDFFKFNRKGGENLPDKTSSKYDYMLVQYQRNMGIAYMDKNQLDSALYYAQAALQTSEKLKLPTYQLQTLHLLGAVNSKLNEKALADVYFHKALILSDSVKNESRKMGFYQRYIPFLFKNNRMKEAKVQVEKLWTLSGETENLNFKLIATGYKKDLFDKLNNTDSAYYYSKLEYQLRELIFNQTSLNTIQALSFKEQLRSIEDAAKKSEEADQRKQNIQFILIAFGIISFIIVFLLLSRSFITNTKAIEFLGIIALLIIFEFLNLLLHPFLEKVTHHSPVLMLLALVCIAALLVPLHHKVEKWATAKLVEKNKTIRLANAKKTIELLDKKPDNL